MNYNEPSIKKKREELSSPKKRRRTTASAVAFRVILFLICAICVSGAGLAYGSFKGIIASAPKNVSLSPQYSSTIIYDDNNKAVQPLHDYSSNRIKVKSEELPDNLKNAFIAIEDERFYEHDGVDFKGILRALWTDLRNGSTSQGASTLTQQLIKNNVFEAGGESNIIAKIKRKIQEQYLANNAEKTKPIRAFYILGDHQFTYWKPLGCDEVDKILDFHDIEQIKDTEFIDYDTLCEEMMLSELLSATNKSILQQTVKAIEVGLYDLALA